MPKSAIKQFLKNEMALVVEPSAAFLSAITSSLYDMGMPTKQVFSVRSYKDAIEILNEKKPRIIISELSLGEQSGLGLLVAQESFIDELSRIAIIVSKNSADSTVAEAAEGQVDAYIVKPVAMSRVQEKLSESIIRKMHPSDYILEIKKGKDCIKVKDFPTASQHFSKAKGLNEKPTLACYYLAQCHLIMKQPAKAKIEYRAGRSFSALNYKCLIGEFECLMQEKLYVEAYGLVEVMMKNFPITAMRLQQFIISAIFSQKFQDLERFYDLFRALEQRTPELIKIISLGFLTAGRHFLKDKNAALGTQYFEMGASTVGRDIDYLARAVDDLVNASEAQYAEKLLALIPVDQNHTTKAALLRFKVHRLILPPEQMVEVGRKIVMNNQATPEVIRLTVNLMVSVGKTTLAESVIHTALKSYPDMQNELYALLENKLE